MLTRLRAHLALCRQLSNKPLSNKDREAIRATYSGFDYFLACERINARRDRWEAIKRFFKDSTLVILLGILIGGPAVAAVLWT